MAGTRVPRELKKVAREHPLKRRGCSDECHHPGACSAGRPGEKLLDKNRVAWAAQDERMADESRRKHCRGFLTKGLEKKPPTKPEFTAYGQACLEMARGIFQCLRDHDAALFASVIPCSVAKPATSAAEEYLRKDHVFLMERYFYFLEER